MNGSRDQKAQGNKNLFETFNVSTNEYLPQSFSVDLDQEDETPQGKKISSMVNKGYPS